MIVGSGTPAHTKLFSRKVFAFSTSASITQNREKMESNVNMQEDAPLFSSAICKTIFARAIALIDYNTLLDFQDPVRLELQRQQLREELDRVPTNLTLNGPASMEVHENKDMRTQANSGIAASENDEASRSGDRKANLNETASMQLASVEDLRTEIEGMKKLWE
jgi:hypothetical protein